MSSEVSPRFHHYIFAHRVLPQFASLVCMNIFDDLERQKEILLKQLWALAAENVELKDCLPFSGFKIYFVKTPPYMGAVIVMPTAKNISEAHMALFVQGMESAGDISPQYRYFTLEYGKNDKSTILCELVGAHFVVYGAGPAVDIRKFWEAALGIIKADVIR
jgi:hypothetical protein